MLEALASFQGVETSYRDFSGHHVTASNEALLGVLQALGLPLECPGEAEACLAECRRHLWESPLEAVQVAWGGRPRRLAVRWPLLWAGRRGSLVLDLEDGTRRVVPFHPARLRPRRTVEAGGRQYAALDLPLPAPLPPGYHRLRLEGGKGTDAEALLIAAPRAAAEARPGSREWGVFLPLYALRSSRPGLSGTFSGLAALADWVGAQGGGVVATLPLLAAFLEKPFEPSPYSPASRLFWIACLRHHLSQARCLRVDHVMGLHRLWWIPAGREGRDGAYVRYPAEELYAILCLESRRHRATLVGEDLGTVPDYLHPAMRRHNLQGMFALEYELRPDRRRPLREVPRGSLAALNTHDMPPWGAFWRGLDIEDRRDLGLLDGVEAKAERAARRRMKEALEAFLRRRGLLGRGGGARAALGAALLYLARSPARILLVNLEDLWQETASQNVPGTTTERPNWRRRARLTLEEVAGRRDVAALLRALDQARGGEARGARAV